MDFLLAKESNVMWIVELVERGEEFIISPYVVISRFKLRQRTYMSQSLPQAVEHDTLDFDLATFHLLL